MININGYDVIYNEIVYKCVDMDFEWGEFSGDYSSIPPTICQPKSLNIACIGVNANEDR